MSARHDTATDDATVASLREQTERQDACSRCGTRVLWFNHLGQRYADCNRCHVNGRLFDQGCRSRTCERCLRTIDGGWREKGWP